MAWERRGSRRITRPRRFNTASVSRSQRSSANGNAPPLPRGQSSSRHCRATWCGRGAGGQFQFENLRRLLDIHALNHAGDKDQPKRLEQFVDRVFDDTLDFTLSHGFFRIA
jgi:hypothetical protein